MEVLKAFFGWCAVINIGLLVVSALFLVVFKQTAFWVHKKLCRLNDEDLERAYFQYLAQYKIFTMVFSIVPYFALSIILNP